MPRHEKQLLGRLRTSTDSISMFGGMSVNVSGPCFNSSQVVKLKIYDVFVDCQMVCSCSFDLLT